MEKPTVVLEKTCSGCGVEIRDGSLFCYNCGGSVGDEQAVLESTSYANRGPGTPAIKNGTGSGTVARKMRASRPKRTNEPVQVTWKRDDGAGIGFLIAAVIIAILALVSLGLAYYLR